MKATMTIMPSDQATANRLMLALGGIVIHFGEFEVALQAAVAVVHHGADEREIGEGDDEKELPEDGLSKGVTYLRKSVKLDGMGPFASDIKRIVSTAYRLANKRNHIMHGYISEFVEETKTVVFHKFNADLRDGILGGSPLPITITELEELREDIAAMASDMLGLAARLTQTFFGESKLLTDFSGDP
jgi:hypothetical protein